MHGRESEQANTIPAMVQLKPEYFSRKLELVGRRSLRKAQLDENRRGAVGATAGHCQNRCSRRQPNWQIELSHADCVVMSFVVNELNILESSLLTGKKLF